MKDFRSIEQLAQNLFQLSVHYFPEAESKAKGLPFADMMFQDFANSLFAGERKTAVYRHNHFIGFLAIPDLSESRIYVFGPALLICMSDFSKSGLAEQYNVRHGQRAAFYSFLEALPVFPSEDLISIAVHLYSQINGSALPAADVRVVDRNWQRADDRWLIQAENHPGTDAEDYEGLHKTQQSIYHYIREGNSEGLSREMKNRKMSFHLGMIETVIDNYKVTASMAITLAMQAAIDGGLDYAVALHTYDLFMLYLNRLTNVRDILNLTAAAQQEYAQKVESTHIPKSYPPVLTKVIRYIQRHLYEPLTAQKVAEATHTSQTYISKLFTRHTGVSTGEYIRMKK